MSSFLSSFLSMNLLSPDFLMWSYLHSDCFWAAFCYQTFCRQSSKEDFLRWNFQWQAFCLGVFTIFLAVGFWAGWIQCVIIFILWLFAYVFWCEIFATWLFINGFFMYNCTARFSNDNKSDVRLFAPGLPDVELFVNSTIYFKLFSARRLITVLISVKFLT